LPVAAVTASSSDAAAQTMIIFFKLVLPSERSIAPVSMEQLAETEF
jgi:hypothetical protein